MKTTVLFKSILKCNLLFCILLGILSFSASAQDFEIESLYPDTVQMYVGQQELVITPTGNPLNTDESNPALFFSEEYDGGEPPVTSSFNNFSGVIVLTNAGEAGELVLTVRSNYTNSSFETVQVTATITVIVHPIVLGEYSDTTIAQNDNIQITPNVSPISIAQTYASSPNFSGELLVDPTTGIITVTNATQVGVYSVFITSLPIVGDALQSSFQLTVNESIECSTSFNKLTRDSPHLNDENALIGDFNNDNIQDFARVIQIGTTANVEILLGDGTGAFNTAGSTFFADAVIPSVNVLNLINASDAGDFNGDGHLDIIVEFLDNVYFLYGDGLGNLTYGGAIFVQGEVFTENIGNLKDFTTGHFNGDGILDLAIGYTKSQIDGGFVGLYFGTASTNTFIKGPIYYDINTEPTMLSASNFNTNTVDEILVVFENEGIFVNENNEISRVLYRTNTNQLVPLFTLDTYGVKSVIKADIDGQGHFDMVALTRNGIDVFLNDNVLGFAPNYSIPLEGSYDDIKVISKTGNNLLDLVISSVEQNHMKILLGDGAGSFSEGLTIDLLSPSAVSIGDFNGDNLQDCLVHNRGNSVLLGANNQLELNSIDNGFITQLGSNRLKYIEIQNTGDTNLFIDRESLSVSGLNPDLFTVIGYSDQVNSVDPADFSTIFPFNIEAGGPSKFIVLLFEPEEAGEFSAILDVRRGDCIGPVTSVEMIENCISDYSGETGTYPNTTIISGENVSIFPTGGVFDFDKLIASTNTNFDGILSVSPINGQLSITNAINAGTYTIKVAGYAVSDEHLVFDPLDLNGNALSVETTLIPFTFTTFELTVLDPICSTGDFEITSTIQEDDISDLTSIAIGDFNNDGKQDLITSYSNNELPSFGDLFPVINLDTADQLLYSSFMKLGDGQGNFGLADQNNRYLVGLDPRSIHVDDYNGDGIHDIVAANSDLIGNTFTRIGTGFFQFELPTKSELNDGNIITPTGAAYSKEVAFADFNNDGIRDLAIVSEGGVDPVLGITIVPGTVSIQLGDGLGGASPDSQTNFKQSKLKFVGVLAQSIVTGDFNGDGLQDFATVSSHNDEISVLLGVPIEDIPVGGLGSAFEEKPNVPVNIRPMSIVKGDFNNDGIQDLAVACSGELPEGGYDYVNNGFVSIRLGTGSGTFVSCPTCEIEVGLNPTNIKLGDFNGDGVQDFAVANTYSNDVSIRFGNGDGTFYGDTQIQVDEAPAKLVVGDFNEDNIQDIAVATANSVNILQGVVNGEQEFVLKGNDILIQNNDSTPSLDDHTDFGNIGLNREVSTETFTIENTGETTLILNANEVNITGADSDLFSFNGIVYPLAIAPGNEYSFDVDFDPTSLGEKNATITISSTNCDETLEYNFAVKATVIPPPILGNYPDTTIVLGGNTSITPDVAPLHTLRTIAYTDTHFTGSLVVNPTSGALEVTNAGQTGNYTVTVQAFTLDNIATSTTFSLTVTSLDNCIQSFNAITDAALNHTGNDPTAIAIGDFNNDGIQDFVNANENSNYLSVKIGNGVDGFTTETDIPVAINTSALDVADFNGDGHLDIAAVNGTTNEMYVITGNGDGSFENSMVFALSENPNALALGDFNTDGIIDIVVSHELSSTVSVLLGDGIGGFVTNGDVIIDSPARHILVADFNADEVLDIATAHFETNSVAIHSGDGEGSFSEIAEITVADGPKYLTIGDFNNDNIQDVASSNNTSISILIGDNTGNFPLVNTLNDIPTTAIKIGEFNGDGIQDIAAINSSNTNFYIFTGTGTGDFIPHYTQAVTTGLSSIAIGDFNNDTLTDIATTATGTSDVFLLLGVAPKLNVSGNNVTIEDGQPIALLSNTTDFGLVQQNTTVTKIYEIENSGNAALEVASITITGPDMDLFTLQGITLPLSIPAGSTQTFEIEFDALVLGEKNAIVDIVTNDCIVTNFDFAIKASAVDTPVIEVYGFLPFTGPVEIVDGDMSPSIPKTTYLGATCINTELIRTYQITNITAIDVTLNPGAITIDGADSALFTVDSSILPAVITPGESLLFTVTFTPESEGLKQATIHIANIGGDLDYDFDIEAQGIIEELEATIGTYSNVTMISGENSTVQPTIAAAGSSLEAIAHTDTNFKGLLSVNPISGDVIITNAHPAGSYQITVETMGVCSSATTTFQLDVDDPVCSSTTLFETVPGDAEVNDYDVGVFVADFNEDGIQDIVISNGGNPNTKMVIKLGNSDGTFTPYNEIIFEGPQLASYFSQPLLIGDFNGDGHQDITAHANRRLAMYLGDGSGNFILGEVIVTDSLNSEVAIAEDFNNDGNLDVLIKEDVLNADETKLVIYLGNGVNGFYDKRDILIDGVRSVDMGDFNHDGNIDLVVANNSDDNIRILTGDGLAGYTETSTLPVVFPEALVIGDFNNDGEQDIAVSTYDIIPNPDQNSPFSTIPANQRVEVYSGNLNGIFSNTPTSIVPLQDDASLFDYGKALKVGDFNADGNQDIVVQYIWAEWTSDYIALLEGNGAGGFTYFNIDINFNFDINGFLIKGFAIGDFNADNRQDIITVGYTDENKFSMILFGAGSKISITGNDNLIENNSTNPEIINDTDFGGTCPTGTIIKTFTIDNKGISDLVLGTDAITISGGDATQFTIGDIQLPITIATNESATFTITYNPEGADVATTTVSITSNDCSITDYTFAIQGSTEELEPPVIECPVIDPVYYANSFSCFTNVPLVVTATDNCTLEPTITSNAPLNNQFPIGETTVIYTATDENGNTATCEFVITVVDNLAPSLSCAEPITVAFGTSIDPADIGSPEATDNCTLESLTYTDSSTQGTEGCSVYNYTITRFWTATDASGNSEICLQVINVADETGPELILQDITVQLDVTGNATITPDDIDNGSTDACDIVNSSIDVTSFDCDDLGANTVSYTATDGNGNVTTATAIVTVEDAMTPEVITQDITVTLDATGNITITPQDIDNGSNDACGIATITLDTTTFNCDDLGENTVLLTVTDNNDNVATAMATVTVENTIAPEAIAQDITITLDASGNASITPEDIDNGSNAICGTVTTSIDSMNFSCANVGLNTVTLTVTDSSNNIATATAIVTVVDDTLPEVITQDITVTLDASGNITITPGDIDNGSNDICGIASITLDTTTFNCDDLGENTVLLTVTDSNDNVATAMATVTVESTLAPEAIAQDISITLDASGNASITPEDIDNGSNAICGTVTTSIDSTNFSCANVGPNTVTLTVTDSSNNIATATAIVTVVDDTLPEVITQDITVTLDASGNITITPEDIDNGSNDICGIATITLDTATFNCDDLGENTVLLTVTDSNNNVATAMATVTVESTIPPEAIAQDITISLDASGNASITPEDIDNGSNSTCGTIILTADIVDFSCADVGANTVTLTATDSSNNMSTTTTIVTVVDDIQPEVITQDITVILGATGNVTITPEDIDNGSNDACGIASLELDILNFDTDDIGENTVQLTVTDTNGNVSVTSAIVTVVDTLSVDHDELDIELSVYPNPTKGNLNLKITNYNTGNLTYQLFSIHGQLLLSDTVHSDITRIPMYSLAKGMYILKVTSSTKVMKSFKVIKSE